MVVGKQIVVSHVEKSKMKNSNFIQKSMQQSRVAGQKVVLNRQVRP